LISSIKVLAVLA